MGSLTIKKSRGTPGVVVKVGGKIKDPFKKEFVYTPPVPVDEDDEDWSPPPPGICYVCMKRIPAGDAIRGVGLERHETCGPGSQTWMKSKIGRNSKYRKLFDGKESDGK